MLLPTTLDDVGGGRVVRVARLGAGPPLVLLHGYPDTLQLFAPLASLLARRFRVIAFDWPGLGDSTAWPGALTPWDMANRLAQLLEAWGLERVSVLGIDMGGQPALAFAARHAGRIDRLVVANCLALHDEKTSWDIGLLRRFGFNRWIIRHWPRLVLRRAEWTSLPPGERLDVDARSDLARCFLRPAVRAEVSRMCAAYQGTLPRLPETFGAVRCPALVLWGERDRHFPLPHARRLHAAIRGSRLHVVAGAEHWMTWHAADEAGRVVEAFLGS